MAELRWIYSYDKGQTPVLDRSFASQKQDKQAKVCHIRFFWFLEAWYHVTHGDGGVVGGSRAGPVVTPHTLELTPLGRVLLQLAPPETARAYLPPEYRPGRVYSDTDSEKVLIRR
ncbi:hypothetical protein K0M31_007932 [Melipona bicolor]|uniref:Uncharacterized protein n=1 Tax=Melipona bicolor TaxID=60889 RepID=A0AA40GCB7_9HYME|nr:hypothetical protein K0M31_007932 [Melipona bicolor]